MKRLAFIAVFAIGISGVFAESKSIDSTLPECKSSEDRIKGCVSKEYDEFGNLEWEVPYKNGKIEGMWKKYHSNGKLESETPYKNDKEEGIKKFYYESGNLRGEISYKNGKRDGIEKRYYESGALQSEALNSDRGKKVKAYYESGEKLSDIQAHYMLGAGIIQMTLTLYTKKGDISILTELTRNENEDKIAFKAKCSNGADISSAFKEDEILEFAEKIIETNDDSKIRELCLESTQ